MPQSDIGGDDRSLASDTTAFGGRACSMNAHAGVSIEVGR